MKIRHIALLASVLFLTALSPVFALDIAWYDPVRQAVAVDPYADGYGGSIQVDFNDDHDAAGVIDQHLWHYLYGSVTEMGLYQTTHYPWGSGTVYGWGDRLGTLSPAFGFSTTVTTFYDGRPAPDGFRYFTPRWDVASGLTVINIQPVVAGAPVPVTAADLDHVFFRVDYGSWQNLGEIYQPDPDPVTATMTISPRTLNRKSAGNWINVMVELPAPYTAGEVDLDSVVLALSAEVTVNGQSQEKIEVTRKVAEAGKGSSKLIAKFSRSELIELLPQGDIEVLVHGKLFDGTPLTGATTLRVIH